MQPNTQNLFLLMHTFLRAMRAKSHPANGHARHAAPRCRVGQQSDFAFGVPRQEMRDFQARHRNAFRPAAQGASAAARPRDGERRPGMENACRITASDLSAATLAHLENIAVAMPEVLTVKMMAGRKKETYFGQFKADPRHRGDWRNAAAGDEIRLFALTGDTAHVGQWIAVKDILFTEKSNRWCMSW